MRCFLEVDSLSVWIDGRKILDGVSLCAPPNSITALVGPSGSGKSTLLRTINRLVELYNRVKLSGDVRIRGKSVFEMDPAELRRRVGMVFQTPNPFPHMSIYDNVALAARVNGVARTREELDSVVRWALEKAMLWDEVKDRLRQKPHVLSGGQKQRLCLARALAMKPELLLLDEPTANVDVANARKIESALEELKSDLTILLVTHNPNQALRVADYVAVMHEGRIVEQGPTRQVVLNPRTEVAAAILGSGW